MPNLPTGSQLWTHGPRSEGPGEISSEPGAALTVTGASCPDPPLPGPSILPLQASMTACPSKSCSEQDFYVQSIVNGSLMVRAHREASWGSACGPPDGGQEAAAAGAGGHVR